MSASSHSSSAGHDGNAAGRAEPAVLRALVPDRSGSAGADATAGAGAFAGGGSEPSASDDDADELDCSQPARSEPPLTSSA